MASLGSNQFHSQISNLPYIPTEKTQIKSIHVHDPKEKTNHLFAHNGGILRLKLCPSVQWIIYMQKIISEIKMILRKNLWA
jgi:hypothetical protein